MKHKIKKIIQTNLFKDSIIYGLTNAIYTGLPLFLLPFFVSVLKPEDYGLMDLFRSFTMVLTPFIGLSTLASIDRFYFDYNETDFKNLVSSTVILHIINGCIMISLLFIYNVLFDSKYYLIIQLAIIFVTINQITEILLVIFRVKNKSFMYFLLRLISVLFDLGLLAVFYHLWDKIDWTLRVFPSVISSLLVGLISIVVLNYYKYPLRLSPKLLKAAIWFSGSLILHMIAGYALNIGNRFFVAHFLGEKELGNFTVAYQIGMAINFFFTSFNLAWTPTFYDWMKNKKFTQIKKVERFILLSLPIIACGIIFMWSLLTTQLDNFSKYNVPISLILIITIAHVFLSYYKFYSLYFFYYKKTKQLSMITFIVSSLFFILNIILIPKYGLFGSANATLISFLLMLLFTYYYSKKLNNESLL